MKLARTEDHALLRQIITERMKILQKPTHTLITDALHFYNTYTLLAATTGTPIPRNEHTAFQNAFTHLITQTCTITATTRTLPPKYQKDDAWKQRIAQAVHATTQEAIAILQRTITDGQARCTHYFKNIPTATAQPIIRPPGSFGMIMEYANPLPD